MRAFIVSSWILFLIAPSSSWARSELETRVTRLENIVANELNVKLLNQLDAMQQEIRELRGKLEEQQNSVQALNQRQEKLFLNLDARLNNLPTVNTTTANTMQPAAALVTEQQIPATTPITTQTAIPPVSVLEHTGTSEKAMYDSANGLMQDQKYAEALIEFKDLLWQFPEGAYAVHAQYWLGELYMLQWQQNRADKKALAQAKEAFTSITNKFHGQDRAGDALLKLGLIEMDQDHYAVAKDILQQVVTKYPHTARARIAETNLARIEKTHFAPAP